jgi:thymidine kinase
MEERANIEVIYGCMYSGKTTELIRRIKMYSSQQISCALFKPEIDNRYDSSSVVSHNQSSLPAISISSSKQIIELLGDVKVIGVDEAQFMDKEIVQVVQSLSEKGIICILSGLDKDSAGNDFGEIPALIKLANHPIQLFASCHNCKEPAQHTFCKVDKKEVVLIGESEKYEALCGTCYTSKMKSNQNKNTSFLEE